ncbi:DUF1254 domain-containing protein [Bradyrhizobium yuanmingense]|uniref:DUF1254 domain-containing protein n=1 Tax=Bradyrhizobium yuanmingense TaxID=108015 RepID=UPI0023B8FD15|nr:DUF1214 domain-containing protein [Bradyrhizobium yuanmingense]MDF0579257.1 DUF1214 domain-containing protein [Bradyrhizobium yuanmingense]
MSMLDARLSVTAAERNPEPLPPSPEWQRALLSGPDPAMKITEEYAQHVMRDAYFWAWPLINMYNRRLAFSQMKEMRYVGALPQVPLNRLAMLTDYIAPDQRHTACPNQDVVYGVGPLALDLSPVVIQVPDFGDRFWVYQIVDLRTDSFANIGKMYGSTPGFYLLVERDWKGKVPKGITQVFRSSTNSGIAGPRAFMDDTSEDRKAIQPVLRQMMMYPLDEFDGTMKSTDWSTLPKLPDPSASGGETRWVVPERAIDQIEPALADAPPLPGEEARYAQVLAVIEASKRDPKLKARLIEAAVDCERRLVDPLLQFRNYGEPLPNHWSTISNGAAFGTDYFTRTAVARSNILVNESIQAKYFYQDLGADGGRLNGANRYTVTFDKGQTPPVNGFWSLTLYDSDHFFVPNEINRYSLGTKNKTLKAAPDGSLTLRVQPDPPPERENWLPAPKGADFSLFLRAYWPKTATLDGTWTPPAVRKMG